MAFVGGGVVVANWGAAWPMVLLPFSVFFVFLLLPASILPLIYFISDGDGVVVDDGSRWR